MLECRVAAARLCVHLIVDNEGDKLMYPPTPRGVKPIPVRSFDLACLTVQQVAVELIRRPYDSVIDFQVSFAVFCLFGCACNAWCTTHNLGRSVCWI